MDTPGFLDPSIHHWIDSWWWWGNGCSWRLGEGIEVFLCAIKRSKGKKWSWCLKCVHFWTKKSSLQRWDMTDMTRRTIGDLLKMGLNDHGKHERIPRWTVSRFSIRIPRGTTGISGWCRHDADGEIIVPRIEKLIQQPSRASLVGGIPTPLKNIKIN